MQISPGVKPCLVFRHARRNAALRRRRQQCISKQRFEFRNPVVEIAHVFVSATEHEVFFMSAHHQEFYGQCVEVCLGHFCFHRLYSGTQRSFQPLGLVEAHSLVIPNDQAELCRVIGNTFNQVGN